MIYIYIHTYLHINENIVVFILFFHYSFYVVLVPNHYTIEWDYLPNAFIQTFTLHGSESLVSVPLLNYYMFLLIFIVEI